MQRRTASERVASRLPSTGVNLPPSASMAACSWNFVTCLRDSIRLACGRWSEALSRRASSRSRSWSLFAPATGTLAVSARSCASQSWQSSALSARAGTGASESNDAAVIAETVRAAIAALLPADLAAPGAVAARGDARWERPLRGERVRDPVIARQRQQREDGAAALANRGLGTRLGLDGDRRLLLAPHAAAVQAANEPFPLRAHWRWPRV